jgi:tetratricopeptide (TPR) repeat protein
VDPQPRLARSAVALVAGFALVAVPVAVRTWAVSREWIPFTYNLGVNLYIGNSPEATGGFSSIMETQLLSPVGPIREDGGVEADGREYLRKVEGLTLGARASSDYWAAKAWSWMRDHPGDVLRLGLRKLAMMWSQREHPQIENADEFALLAGPLGLPGMGSFAFFGALAIPGLVLAWRRGRAGRFTLGYVVVVTLAVLPFFVVDRYRHHLIPGVALLAALTLDRIGSLAQERKTKGLIVLGAGVLAGLAVTFTPGPAMSKRKYEWGLAVDIGSRWLARGQPDLAAQAFERALRLEPRSGTFGSGAMLATEHADLYYNYGLALKALSRDAEALAWFERAVRVAPDRAPAIRALADACLRRGEAARADSLYAVLESKVGGEGLSFEGRGWLAAQQGRLDEAAALFDRAVRSEPDLIDAWGALIRAQVQLGRLAAAESTLARAETAGLPRPSLQAHRALVEILAGHGEAAERALSEVPEEAIAADSVLADVVQVARRALKGLPQSGSSPAPPAPRP